MLALVALVVSVGIVDSLNPSTIGPALYLVTAPNGARCLAGFTAGILAVAFAGGLALTLGPGQAILAAVPRPSHEETNEIEMALGALTLAVALALWVKRRAVERRFSGGGARTTHARSAFYAGAAIMAIELPTALPYFAVITAIVSSGRRASIPSARCCWCSRCASCWGSAARAGSTPCMRGSIGGSRSRFLPRSPWSASCS